MIVKRPLTLITWPKPAACCLTWLHSPQAHPSPRPPWQWEACPSSPGQGRRRDVGAPRLGGTLQRIIYFCRHQPELLWVKARNTPFLEVRKEEGMQMKEYRYSCTHDSMHVRWPWAVPTRLNLCPRTGIWETRISASGDVRGPDCPDILHLHHVWPDETVVQR